MSPPSPPAETSPPPLDYAAAQLRRQIGLFGAVMLGLGSILGTGVFVGLAQATALAGPWVLVAIVLAGLLAFCNAMSSAQLAAAHPVSGGTYEYGYRLLSPTWGFTAGWTFLLAKSASAATAVIAVVDILLVNPQLQFGPYGLRRQNEFLYLVDAHHDAIWFARIGATPFIVGLFSIGVLVVPLAAVMSGIRRSARLNSTLVALTVLGLIALIVLCTGPMTFNLTSSVAKVQPPVVLHQFLNAVALVFVAFTGYGRLATLGEEVRDPQRIIPRAIGITLLVSASLYLAVGLFTLITVMHVRADQPGRLLTLTDVPTENVRFGSSWSDAWLQGLLSLAALTAMLGVLLNLILGLSRVWLAMGRRGDMPRGLARVSERSGTPLPATIVTGLVIAAFVLVGDVRLTWSFSAFSVLIYYAITNWACLRLPAEHRRYPRALAMIGLVACLSLAWFVEVKVWAAGVVLIAVGLVWHRLRANSCATLLVPSPP